VERQHVPGGRRTGCVPVAYPEDSLPRPLQFKIVESRRVGIESQIRDHSSVFKERFSTQFVRAVFSAGKFIAFARGELAHSLER
jgi:hypothetical protein